MILTVTLNPAIDLLVELPELEPERVLRSSTATRVAAGKGVNVARVAAQLAVPARAIVLVGRDSAAEYAMLSNATGLSVELVTTPGPTRINIGLLETASGRHFKINTSGGRVPPDAVVPIVRSIEGASSVARAVVVSGSLPPGLELEAMATLVDASHRARIPVFVDAEGDALCAALAARPTGAKANLAEWCAALGVEASDACDLLAKTVDDQRTKGLAVMAVTDGARGAALRDAKGTWSCAPTATVGRRTVGAGDAFMAGLVVGWSRGECGGPLLASAMAAAESVAHHQRGTLPMMDEIASRRARMQPVRI